MSRKKSNAVPNLLVQLSLKEQVLSSLDGRIYRINKTLGDITEENRFSTYAIKWYSEELVMCDILKGELENLRKDIDGCEKEAEVKYWLTLHLKSSISAARSSSHNSTSAFSNAVQFAQQKAYFEIIDFVMNYIFE